MKKISNTRIFLAALLLMITLFGFKPATGATISVISPNGGETLIAGTTNAITWTSDVTGNLRIALLKNGVQYALIAGALPNTGTFNWLIPAWVSSGSDYTVKISSCLTPSVFDVSNADFTISGGSGSTITVLTPNGGENWVKGTPNTITWTSDVIGNVRISLLKNGVQYSLIAASVPNNGTYTWLIPAGLAIGSDYKVKISSSANSLISDVSDATFSLISGGGTTITLTSPNGGESWTAGTSNIITWTSDVTGNLRITLLKNGIQYAIIAGALPNTGTYSWLIPAWVVSGADYSVKIASCLDPLLTDVSDANFAITGGSGSTITVVTPNGGENWIKGTANTITWTSDVTGNLRITLLKNGIQYAIIAGALSNTGTYSWLIPTWVVPGADYSIKISACMNTLVSDVSDANFSIAAGDNTQFKTSVGDDASVVPALNLYPNPAADLLNISSEYEISRVKLLNTTGQVVLEKVSDSRQVQLNTSGLNSGIYFVRIEAAGSTLTRKIVIK